MILADTSIWIDHLRRGDLRLSAHLRSGQVLGHPFVRGEIACGTLRDRASILALLGDLPQAVAATDEEVMLTIERHALMGIGIGYVDAHLLTSVLLTAGGRLWTRDRRLDGVARRLGRAAVDPA